MDTPLPFSASLQRETTFVRLLVSLENGSYQKHMGILRAHNLLFKAATCFYIEETHSKMVYAFFLVRITSPDGVLSRLKWLKCPTNNQAGIPKNI